MGKASTTSATNTSTAARSVRLSKPSSNRRPSPPVRPKPAQQVKPTVGDTPLSKCDQVLKLLRRNKGASLAELQEVTGWQAHSVRGFLSGTVKKRMGLSLFSVKPDKGDRRYMISEA